MHKIPLGLYCYVIDYIEYQEYNVVLHTTKCKYYKNKKDSTIIGYCSYCKCELEDVVKICGKNEDL